MSVLDEVRQEIEGVGEGSPSPSAPTMDLFPAKKTQPHDWLADTTVLAIDSDARALAWVETMLGYIDARASQNLPTYLCIDSETCPQTGLIHDLNRRAEVLRHAENNYRLYPPPAKIKDPAKLEQRNTDKVELDRLRADWSEFLKYYKRAGLSITDGQVRLLQVYRPIEWEGEIVNTCWVFDRWKLSPDTWKALNKVLAHPSVHWIGHHVLFDMMMLDRSGLTYSNVPQCTMLQAHALVSDITLGMSLAGRCEEVLGKAMDKTQRLSDWSLPELKPEQVRYASADVVATWELFVAQSAMIDERSANPDKEDPQTVYMLLQEALPAVAEMSLSGIGFDMEQFQHLRDEIEDANNTGLMAALAAFKEHSPPGAPPVDNPGSTAQLNTWAAAVLPDSVRKNWPRTKTGMLQFGQDEIKYQIVTRNLPDEYVPPIQALIDWAEAKKNWQTFSDFARWARPVLGTGEYRMFGKLRIGGAETGRFSIQDPPLQTIKRDGEFRKMFKARKGHKLIVKDYGQIEVRVAAVLSGDATLLYAIQHGLDVHTMTALACFANEPSVRAMLDENIAAGRVVEGDEWVKTVQVKEVLHWFKAGPGKVFRQIAKIATFGLLYGQGPTKLAWTLFAEAGLIRPVDECRQVQKLLLNQYPGLKAWMNRTRNAAEHDNMCWTPAGRRYPAGVQWYTKSINTPCQGGAAEIMLRALSYFPEAWGDLRGKARLVLTVHDELLAEAPEEHAAQVSEIMERCMVQGALDLFPTMPTYKLCEGEWGDDWYSAKSGA